MLALPVPRARGARHAHGWRSVEGEITSLQPELIDVIETFDSQRTAGELTRDLAGDPNAASVASAIRLAATHGWLEEPAWKSLPIEVLGAARFRCLGCGTSCRNLSPGPLQDHDVERLLALDLQSLGVQPEEILVERELDGKVERFLRKQDGACIFLDHANQQCRVHASFGADAKPMVCQTFPSRLIYVPGGLRLSLYSGCVQRHQTWEVGTLLTTQEGWVRAMQQLGFGRKSHFPRWVLYLPEQAQITLGPRASLGYGSYLEIEARLLEALADDSLPLLSMLELMLRWLFGLWSGQVDQEIPAEAHEEARRVSLEVYGIFASLGEAKGDRELTGVARGLANEDPFPTWEAETDGLARELVRHEVWSQRLLELTDAFLPSLVLLSHAVVTAVGLARALSGPSLAERLNRAFYRMMRVLPILELSTSGPLLAFARAPNLS